MTIVLEDIAERVIATKNGREFELCHAIVLACDQCDKRMIVGLAEVRSVAIATWKALEEWSSHGHGANDTYRGEEK